MRKPKLTTTELIMHLKEKGVRFTIDTEEDAFSYLTQNNNFFKLTAYRKNYSKNSLNKYVNLEFAYLKDLAIIDMRIRKCLLDMCLDVEHNTRVRIIKAVEDSSDDGYTIVNDFYSIDSTAVDNSYSNASKSPYCRDIIAKYKDEMPIWAFVEIQQFGSLCKLFKFISDRFGDTKMKNEYYMLQEIRKIRNACAHSNCILNDLKSSQKNNFPANNDVVQAVSKAGISKGSRKKKLSNDRVRQMVTLLYYYKQYIHSEGLQKYQGKQLYEAFVRRPSEHGEYYSSAEQILTFFSFMQKLVDIWYPFAYNNTIVKKS